MESRKVLVWKSKCGDAYYPANTHEEMLDSYLKLFQAHKEWDFYCYLEKSEKPLYEAALQGNREAAMKLIQGRRGCEYEDVTLERM